MWITGSGMRITAATLAAAEAIAATYEQKIVSWVAAPKRVRSAPAGASWLLWDDQVGQILERGTQEEMCAKEDRYHGIFAMPFRRFRRMGRNS